MDPSGAVIVGEYRYALWRDVGPGGPAGTLLWIMLNPSTADAADDDHTIRKILGLSMRWCFGKLRVVNLYALRSRDPKALWTHPDPVGPQNDGHILRELERADGVMLAWGTNAGGDRASTVRQIIARSYRGPVWHLGLTQAGHPKHPLMIGYNTPRVEVSS